MSSSKVANPFTRPSAAPSNPDARDGVLALDDYRPNTPPAPHEQAPSPASQLSTPPSVAPKPLPPPEMEEKKIRVSVKLTSAEHWELKRRIANSNMGVDEYLRTLLFPECRD